MALSTCFSAKSLLTKSSRFALPSKNASSTTALSLAETANLPMGVSTTFVQPISMSMPQVSRTQITIFVISGIAVEKSYPQNLSLAPLQSHQRANLEHAKKSLLTASRVTRSD
jgi:hypothetical protein